MGAGPFSFAASARMANKAASCALRDVNSTIEIPTAKNNFIEPPSLDTSLIDKFGIFRHHLSMTRLLCLALIFLSQALEASGNSKVSQWFSKTSPEAVALPQGFKINVFASGLDIPRHLALGANGTVFVGTRSDKVYALVDQNLDGVSDKTFTLASGLNYPNGVAFKDGDLWIGEIHQIRRIKNVEAELRLHSTLETVLGDLPKDTHHGLRVIRFAPDGALMIPVGAPCNICNPNMPYARILKWSLNSKEKPHVYVEGVRNSVGYDWDPLTNELWFTDNGRDHLGDNVPPCELNHASKAGLHFGYPFCHGKNISDPEFGNQKTCSSFVPATQELGPHVAPLGMRFYRGSMFPVEYKNQIFIAEHGSWNRSDPIGYRITLVRLDEKRKPVKYETFLSGWLQDRKVHARPVDLLEMPDGSLLISDDFGGKIFRVSYHENQTPLKTPDSSK